MLLRPLQRYRRGYEKLQGYPWTEQDETSTTQGETDVTIREGRSRPRSSLNHMHMPAF